MKIAAIKTYVLSADLKTPFAYSQGWYDKRMALIVEVVTDEGLSGFGEVYGPPRPNRGVVEAYAPLLSARIRSRSNGTGSASTIICAITARGASRSRR